MAKKGPWADGGGGYQESGMGRPIVVNLKAPDARDPKHQEKDASATVAETAPDADDSPKALLHRVATDHSLRLLDHSNRLLPRAYDDEEVEAAFQAHYTVRRIFCIAILNLWAGVDNIIAGVIDYFSDAGVGVLAGASSVGFGLLFCTIALTAWIKRKTWQHNHNGIRWLCFGIGMVFFASVSANAISRYHVTLDHDINESMYFGYHAAGLITITFYVLAHCASPLFMFSFPAMYAVLICSSPWASSLWLGRFCLSHIILFTVLATLELKDQREAFEDKVCLHQAELKTEQLHKDEQRAAQSAAKEAQQRIRDVHEARESTYTSLLKMLSHDFKGTVLNLETQLSLFEGHEALTAELHHILHSIMSIKYRYAMEPWTHQEADSTRLTDLMKTMALLFPDVEFHIVDVDVAIVPCLLHLVVHQLLRNCRVHGGGKITCSVTVEGDSVIISTRNLPGANHDKLMAAGTKALQLALSRAMGVVSSSGLGLQDILHIMRLCNCKFSIDWKPEGVLAQVRIPIIRRPVLTCVKIEDELMTPIRVCVIDDQLGPRMASVKLIKLINPQYKAPAKLARIKAIWEDEFVKVAGVDLPEVQECVQWINRDPMRTIIFLDRMLEFPACVVDGLTLIPKLSEFGGLVVLRSGNDSNEDRDTYIQQGAFGCIGKVLHGGHGTVIIDQAKRHIADRLEESAKRWAVENDQVEEIGFGEMSKVSTQTEPVAVDDQQEGGANNDQLVEMRKEEYAVIAERVEMQDGDDGAVIQSPLGPHIHPSTIVRHSNGVVGIPTLEAVPKSMEMVLCGDGSAEHIIIDLQL